MLVLKRYDIVVSTLDDTMLMSYVFESGDVGHGMDELSVRHLGHKPISFKDVAGSGKTAVTFDRVSIERATQYAAEDADITLRLWMLFKHKLLQARKVTVYETLERPLVPVLVQMESEGILVDRQVLARLSQEFGTTQAAIETDIHKIAGSPFNIGSPKQLGDILFGQMGLQGGRKTATGAWSTDADTLEDLAAQSRKPTCPAPASNLIDDKVCPAYSKAVCQSTVCHWPSCLIIGAVKRSGEFRPS